ncbi:MAG: hypothetical protein ACREMB_04790 [Candidatus Rokuibacteriota bacterium]
MEPYDSRRITLDPGRTMLALRGLRTAEASYPFIERHVRWRRSSRVWRDRLAAWFPTVRAFLVTRATSG